MNNVVITGYGMMSSLGNDPHTAFEALLKNETGVKAYPEWKKYNGLHSFLGAPAKPYDEKVIPRVARRSMSRMSEMALIATKQALMQAKVSLSGDNLRKMLIFGSTSGSPDTLETYYRKLIEKGGPEGQLSTSFFKVMNHSVAANVALGLETKIPNLAPSSACSSSSQAIAVGWELLQTGLYDLVVVGGADELHYTSTAVFDNVLAASRGYNDSPEATPRPFDLKRDGLVVSEGAGVLVMETEAHANQREAKILAELAGASYYCDGNHMSQPQSDSMKVAMLEALRRAGVDPKAVDYVNAHATGTVLGDIQEAKATAEVVGSQVPVSSLKGHFGHSLAACGAIEVIMSIEMMHRSLLIPTRNLEQPDPECQGINLIQKATEQKVSCVLSNNFAFGGMNTSLVIR